MKALLIAAAAFGVPEPVRDTSYDWRCVGPANEIVSEHQRQDRAIVACQNAAIQSPGSTYYIEGGRYRVVAAPPASCLPPVTIQWNAPERMSNGDPLMLSDIAEYRIYVTDSAEGQYGPVPLVVPANEGELRRMAFEWSPAAPGTYYFAVTAVLNDGTESAFSSEVIKVVE